MFELDFSLLPEIVRHRIFKGLPQFVEEPLKACCLPNTVDRLRAASLFLGEVGPSRPDWENRAYLRAGFSEFRSVAQALHWDLGRREVHSPDKSRNPLVHLVFRLRRLTVYVANAPTAEREVTARFRAFDEDHSVDISVLLIDGIEQYISRENMKDYRLGDVERICEWFDINQRQFGAPQVLDIGVMLYAQELADVYASRATGA